jgi:hypothetical protein
VTAAARGPPLPPLPEGAQVACCSQFAVLGEAVREHPREMYAALRDWAIASSAPSSAAVVLEHAWPLIFRPHPGKRKTRCVVCESSHVCKYKHYHTRAVLLHIADVISYSHPDASHSHTHSRTHTLSHVNLSPMTSRSCRQRYVCTHDGCSLLIAVESCATEGVLPLLGLHVPGIQREIRGSTGRGWGRDRGASVRCVFRFAPLHHIA